VFGQRAHPGEYCTRGGGEGRLQSEAYRFFFNKSFMVDFWILLDIEGRNMLCRYIKYLHFLRDCSCVCCLF